MFRKFIGEKYFCGLDVGAQTIKAGLIESKENRQFELLGVYEGNTAGFDGTSVTDLGELSASINTVLSGLVSNTRVKIKTVQMGIGGELIRQRLSTSVMPLLDRGSKVISRRDIVKIQKQAQLLGVKMDEIILHDFPQSYKVDDINRALNPSGLYGRKLEIDTLIVAVNGTIIKNLSKAVNQAGYDVENIFFTTYAATMTALDDFQRKQGCLFVDIGASVTDLVIFKGGQLRFLSSIPLGSDDITRAIAARLNISHGLADDIKKSYGVVRHRQAGMNEEILIKSEEGYTPVKKEAISEALDPVVNDLINMLKASVARSELERQLPGIIMSGGGSLLTGLPERLEEEMVLPVKMASINFCSRKMHNAAKFLSSVGLAHAGFDKSLGLFVKRNQYSHWLKGLVDRSKELYEEYF
ncbi:MAG: cell division protein FtsA [Candidatus Omnitrophota bacterium]